jgi:hypothetical protein
MEKISRQVIGNTGLYYVCYELSKRGWNVLPTSRNARGVDIVIYSQKARRKLTIQVKSLRKRNPAPLGDNPENLFADYLIICRNVLEERPEVFIMRMEDVKKGEIIHEGIKNGKKSYWIQPKSYEKFRDRWNIIGDGYE